MREFFRYKTADGKEFTSYDDASQHTDELVDQYIADNPGLQDFMNEVGEKRAKNIRRMARKHITGADYGLGANELSQTPLYSAHDGSIFESAEECKEHEEDVVNEVLESGVTMKEFFSVLREGRAIIWDTQRKWCLDYAAAQAENERWLEDQEAIHNPLGDQEIANALRRELRRSSCPL